MKATNTNRYSHCRHRRVPIRMSADPTTAEATPAETETTDRLEKPMKVYIAPPKNATRPGIAQKRKSNAVTRPRRMSGDTKANHRNESRFPPRFRLLLERERELDQLRLAPRARKKRKADRQPERLTCRH